MRKFAWRLTGFVPVLVFVTFPGWTTDAWPSVAQKLSLEGDLSQFLALVQNSRTAKSALHYRELTVFAPTDEAFRTYDGMITDELVLYHMISTAKTLKFLNPNVQLNSISEQHPPIWMNRKRDAIFANDAMILANRSDFFTKTRDDGYGKIQVLHVIDRVLNPMSNGTKSPSAYDFLVQNENWKLIPHTFHIFHKKIVQFKMEFHFKQSKPNTYFVPVDQYFDRDTVYRVDEETVDCNVIRNMTIFLRAFSSSRIFHTQQNDRDFYTTVEFVGDETRLRVTRYSRLTSLKMHEQIVQILHPNVPVKNGVVHVTQNVLGVFDRKLTKFPYLPVLNKLQTDPQLNTTNYLLDLTQLTASLTSENINYTLFLPTDSAWKKLARKRNFPLGELFAPKFAKNAWKIMRRHLLIGDYFDLQRLLDVSDNYHNHDVTLDVGTDKIYVKVVKNLTDFHLKWGKNSIRIARPDYLCSNGVIHLLDAPLAFDSEFEPIATDGEKPSWLIKAWNSVKLIL